MFGKTHLQCQKQSSLDGLISFTPYRGMVKEAIKKLKYRFVTDLAEELITVILDRISAEKQGLYLKKLKQATLIPVPLHPRKKRQRGFNQAELLGKIIAEKMDWGFNDWFLVRQRHTKSQSKLKGQQRRENVKGVFKVNQEGSQTFSGISYVILFDDVWTTGSTLRECGQVLKEVKVKKVWGLTLAR